MSWSSTDCLLKNAADCLLRAMQSEPGSPDERRYLMAVQIFTRTAEGRMQEPNGDAA